MTKLLKTTLNCAYCGNSFTIKEHRIFYLRYLPKVCSIDCFVRLITTGKEIEEVAEMASCIRKDLYIQNNYKSGWEVEFSKFLINQKIDFLYEPFAFNVFKDNYYIPDFYLPNSGVFIEVKGKWEKQAKNKFLSFISKFGFRTYLANEAVMNLIRRGKW